MVVSAVASVIPGTRHSPGHYDRYGGRTLGRYRNVPVVVVVGAYYTRLRLRVLRMLLEWEPTVWGIPVDSM